MEWDYQTFGRWLRTARVSKLPVMSQDHVADRLGVAQARISRWELEKPNTEAPTLDQCGVLADLFDVDFIGLAKLCGRWNDDLQKRVLVSLASSTSELSDAPVAQLALAA